jgi:penicillin-binding protein 1A
MREALVRSQNVPAVRLAAAVGTERLADFVRRAGITGDVPASPVAALGVTTATPLELAVAYAAFATGGTRPAPRFIVRVEDEDGDVLLAMEPSIERVTDRATAFLMTDMLRDVVDRGTGTGVRRVGFDGAAAGKTGTTSEATDVWFVGYTPELVGAVWMGFDEERPLPSRATGGGVTAPVWGRVMEAAYADRATPSWRRPPEVVARTIDSYTGLVVRDGCVAYWIDVRQEFFVEGREPISTCYEYSRRSNWLERFFSYRSVPPPPSIPGPVDPDLGVPRLPTVDRPAEPEYLKKPRGRRGPIGREVWI